MILARSDVTEGSSKTSKGAKRARFFHFTLRPSSCSPLQAIERHCRVPALNRLTVFGLAAYSAHVADKDATGFGDLKYMRRTTAIWRSFFVQAIASPMSGGGGDTFGYAGFRVCRFANPAICRSPRLATGRAVLQPHTEAHMPGSNSSVLPPSKPPEVGPQHSFHYKDSTLGFSFEHPEIVFSGPSSKHYAAQQWERTTAAKIAIGRLDGAPN